MPETAQAYTVHGAASCRDWASDDYDKGWALGYLSGFNAATASDLGSEIDNDELVRRVAALCRAKPDQDFDDALQTLVERLSAKAKASPSSQAETRFRPIDITDLKLDIASLDGQAVSVRASITLMGGMAMLTDPRQSFDTNPVFADTESLSRDDRQYILTRCNLGCEVTVRGIVAEVMMQPGVKMLALQR
ncbi:MAG: hypothetical protein ACO305_11565 [Rubrivivax sp.]